MMDCRQIKQLLPLWIGQDLPDSKTTAEVARHLAQCPDCEKRRVSLQSSLETLQLASVSAFSEESAPIGLWPRLFDRISAWETMQHRERFNGYIPAGVMALAVALMIAVSLPSIRDEFFGGSSHDTSVVDFFETMPELNLNAAGQHKVSRGGINVLGGESAVATPVDYKQDQW